MNVVREYAEQIVKRAREPMEPRVFEPDWGDQPLRHKVYRDAHEVGLPRPQRQSAGRLPDGVRSAEADPSPAESIPFDSVAFAGMLQDSYGLGHRRLRVNGNKDNEGRAWYANCTWARGTASGGGLYPLEIYWAPGVNVGLTPGIYHYFTPHHTLRSLSTGDVTDRVRAALPRSEETDHADGFLLISVKIWKNSFKYNSFSYHAVTMDVGTLLGTWQTWARAHGLRIQPRFWFDEYDVDQLLGLDTETESVMAVVPVSWTHASTDDEPVRRPQSGTHHEAKVRKSEYERSRTLIRFPQVDEVHAATAAASDRPDDQAGRQAFVTAPNRDGVEVPLPDPDREAIDRDIRSALRWRRSSFGQLTAQPSLPAATLSNLLHFGSVGGRLRLDEFQQSDECGLNRLGVFVNHVGGVAPGTYDYQPGRNSLGLVTAEPLHPFLQQHYFLDNYNLEQAAAILVVIGRPTAAVDELGPRGYRVINADVAALAQAIYTNASALGVGCGAVLGFDNVAMRERFELTDTDQWPLLLIMVGNERADTAELDLRMS